MVRCKSELNTVKWKRQFLDIFCMVLHSATNPQIMSSWPVSCWRIIFRHFQQRKLRNTCRKKVPTIHTLSQWEARIIVLLTEWRRARHQNCNFRFHGLFFAMNFLKLLFLTTTTDSPKKIIEETLKYMTHERVQKVHRSVFPKTHEFCYLLPFNNFLEEQKLDFRVSNTYEYVQSCFGN